MKPWDMLRTSLRRIGGVTVWQLAKGVAAVAIGLGVLMLCGILAVSLWPNSKVPIQEPVQDIVYLDQGWGEDFCRAVFRAEFGAGRCIEDAATISDVLAGLKVEPAPVLAAARSDAIKARLRSETEEAQRLGLFGAPSFVCADGELFWGNDRLESALRWATKLHP